MYVHREVCESSVLLNLKKRFHRDSIYVCIIYSHQIGCTNFFSWSLSTILCIVPLYQNWWHSHSFLIRFIWIWNRRTSAICCYQSTPLRPSVSTQRSWDSSTKARRSTVIHRKYSEAALLLSTFLWNAPMPLFHFQTILILDLRISFNNQHRCNAFS